MKKKNVKSEPRFAVTRRGYDVKSVEGYIDCEEKKSECVRLEQRERILTLTAQLDALTLKVKDFEKREEQIKSAIVSATEKADTMTSDVRLRYAMELDRLNAFRAKWTGVYAELKERYSFSKDALNMESAAVSAKLEIERFLSQDFSLAKGGEIDDSEKQFKSEAERLGKTESGVAELRDKLLKAAAKKEENAAAFSLEAATHPTESLAELCEYLGLKK